MAVLGSSDELFGIGSWIPTQFFMAVFMVITIFCQTLVFAKKKVPEVSKFEIPSERVSEIVSVYDSQGREYFEVDHYICWGTPNDLQTYQYWQRFFNKVEWHPYNYDRDYFSS